MFADEPPGVIAVKPPAGYVSSSASCVSRAPRCWRFAGSRRGSVLASASAAAAMWSAAIRRAKLPSTAR